MPNYSTTPQAPAQITCSRCTSLFGRKYEYDRHIADVHAPKYVCRYCGKQISSRKDKKRDHLRHKHKISWPGGPDCHEELFLDQHYFRQNDTSSTSSPADPASNPLSPPPFTSSQFQSQSLRVSDYPILSNVPHSGNGQNWETLQRQVLYPQGESEFLGPSTTAVGYMQDTSVPNCHATMDNYSTRGIAAMQTASPSVNISSVPRNSATLTTNLPTRSPTPYASSLDSSSDFQNFVPAPDWFSLATSANGAWNQYSQQ